MSRDSVYAEDSGFPRYRFKMVPYSCGSVFHVRCSRIYSQKLMRGRLASWSSNAAWAGVAVVCGSTGCKAVFMVVGDATDVAEGGDG